MAHKYFSSDFHFGFESLLKLDSWPFKSIEKHDAALIRSCKERAKPEDIIYHLGDLACFKQDAHLDSKGLDVKPYELIKDIPATFLTTLHMTADVTSHASQRPYISVGTSMVPGDIVLTLTIGY